MTNGESSAPQGVEELRKNSMMAHLLSALEEGKDIGHYGRLVFAMVAHHFVSEDELIRLLRRNPGFDEHQARALCKQVSAHDYNPPRREKILEWQTQQEFPICPSDDPDACNVYRDLKMPKRVYQHIEEYYEEK